MNVIEKHSDKIKAIQDCVALLSPAGVSAEETIEFIKWFLLNRNRFVLYMGAGVSKTVRYRKNRQGRFEDAVTQTWRELLIEVFKKLDNLKKKDAFLRAASARLEKLKCLPSIIRELKRKGNEIGYHGDIEKITIQSLNEEDWLKIASFGEDRIVDELLDILGPFRFAWCLRWFTEDGKKPGTTITRDLFLSEIVNSTIDKKYDPDSDDFKKITFHSDLISEAIRLPFREIVTTNFDHYLLEFLEDDEFLRENPNRKKIRRIYDESTLVDSLKEHRTKIYYLHGMASVRGKHGSSGEYDRQPGSEQLVFDKYDYAQLFTQKNQILDHLVRLFLRYGVLYMGFGLDDQTFDYMNSQIRALCHSEGISRNPKSYALMRKSEISQNEIETLEKLYNITVITYMDHSHVPKLLKNINLIVRYISDKGILDWPDDDEKQIAEVGKFQCKAAESFLKGNLEDCKRQYRQALAHTLFWTEEASQTDAKRWEKSQKICEIRRNLTLVRSKLRYSTKWEKAKEQLHIKTNFSNSEAILKRFSGSGIRLSSEVEDAVVVEKLAIEMLKARIDYQEGKFREAIGQFEALHISNKSDSTQSEAISLVSKVVSKALEKRVALEKHEIKLLETYYFVQCEFDRASSIFSNNSNTRVTKELVEEVTQIHREQVSLLCRSGLKQLDTERVVALQELGTVAVIAKWSRAIGDLRDFSRFFVGDDLVLDDLKGIIGQLEEGWEYANCNNSPTLPRKITKENKKYLESMPSPRWVTVKHRSMSRAQGLLWYNDPTNLSALTNAYKSIQKALDLTKDNEALYLQHVRNLLEAVRLNTITNYKEVIKRDSNTNSSMCFAASHHYLREAFSILERLLGGGVEERNTNPQVWWILIQAYELGYFWKEVFRSFSPKDESGGFFSEFLTTVTKKKVVEKYNQFGEQILGDSSKVSGRIRSFEKVNSSAIGILDS